MVKKKSTELKSKEELMEIMNNHLITQQEMAEKLKTKALKFIDKEEDKREDKKNRNQYIYAYNQQVEAVSKTASALIKIQGSSLMNENQLKEENQTGDLVD